MTKKMYGVAGILNEHNNEIYGECTVDEAVNEAIQYANEKGEPTEITVVYNDDSYETLTVAPTTTTGDATWGNGKNSVLTIQVAGGGEVLCNETSLDEAREIAKDYARKNGGTAEIQVVYDDRTLENLTIAVDE